MNIIYKTAKWGCD